MSESSAKALQGLYKKMTNKDAKGNTKVQVLNEIAASMGATKKSETTAKCIDDITANYTPGSGGGGGSSDFTIAEVTVINNSANISNAVIITGCVAVDDENYPTSVGQVNVYSDSSGIKYNYIMYKGEATLLISAGVNTSTITVTGDYTTDGFSKYWITGNCTVTLTD